MKFQEIDRLAQSVDKLPDIANLGGPVCLPLPTGDI